MDEFSDDTFDERKVAKVLKKGKRKSMLTTVFTAIIVLITAVIANFVISVFFSQSAFRSRDAFVRLTIPNGYISQTLDTVGILGGTSHYKVSKDMGFKAVVIEQDHKSFGLVPNLVSRYHGGQIGLTGDDWQLTYKNNGWREMLFFHPAVDYEQYKDDRNLIEEMDGDNIYEVALSFDLPYTFSELPFVELPELTWLWLDTFNEVQIASFQQEALEFDWTISFIREFESLGFTMRDRLTATTTNNFRNEYYKFLDLLSDSFYPGHKEALANMEQVEVEDIEILGAVIYGTKEEVLEIMEHQSVKAASLGGIIEHY
ncbi:Sigma factor regulator N-terminal [Amphibacillus marinus]|uniref:Sigma factor regulator N-terminal n=1 Tax=Amphibacillus marinus TaxID=872970 RepID=A0A1H8LM28_9BACI|nr:anti sigma factor C-terminal domain-containing protein [Amphibacillus marinus]SEO05838.1 Sigma factor regulator N-terminal [Amphibacillus marinus]